MLCPLVGTIFDGKTRQEPVCAHHKDGHRVAMLVNTYPLYDDSTTIGAMEIFHPTALFEIVSEGQKAPKIHDEEFLNYQIIFKLYELKKLGLSFSVTLVQFDDIPDRGTFAYTAEILQSHGRHYDVFGVHGDYVVGIYANTTKGCEAAHENKLREILKQNLSIPFHVSVISANLDDNIGTLFARLVHKITDDAE